MPRAYECRPRSSQASIDCCAPYSTSRPPLSGDPTHQPPLRTAHTTLKADLSHSFSPLYIALTHYMRILRLQGALPLPDPHIASPRPRALAKVAAFPSCAHYSDSSSAAAPGSCAPSKLPSVRQGKWVVETARLAVFGIAPCAFVYFGLSSDLPTATERLALRKSGPGAVHTTHCIRVGPHPDIECRGQPNQLNSCLSIQWKPCVMCKGGMTEGSG